MTAAGDTLALADGPGDPAGDAPVFAGPLVPGDEAVELRALAGQGCFEELPDSAEVNAGVGLRAGEQTVTVEPVPVADGLGAFTALLDAGTVQATARDAAGEVLAESRR